MFPPSISRRQFLGLGAAGGLAGLSALGAAPPRRGGTLTLRGWDPPHFDPMLTTASRTQILLSFTHSRLVRYAAGPGVRPGELRIEGDAAESWTQPTETAWVFRLRRGIRWHPLPPVAGRELTAEDVVYSVERFRTLKGNPNAHLLDPLERIEALDRHTVRLTLREPFAWLLQALANPVTLPIVARECVERFGDLRRPEALVGTGPWMLERYEPGTRISLRRHPSYFAAHLPWIDGVELLIDEDNASRIAAFLAGKYDLGWEFPGVINRTDWIQLRERLRRARPRLATAEFPANAVTHIAMRSDRPPFSDVRVRRAISLAIDRREFIDVIHEGVGSVNPPVPAALTEWSLPVDRLGEGAAYYRHDPAEARRLLAAAGYPSGFATVVDFTPLGSTLLVDAAQLILRHLKAVGIRATLNQKEYGAFVATTALGNYEGLVYAPTTPFLDPDTALFTLYAPRHPRNLSHVDDPVLTDLLMRQRRAGDAGRRRLLLHAVQRHLAGQQYYVHLPSPVYVAVWDGALQNYGPNLGYDYGGRLVAAWLDR